jgi:hypothetical protein
MLVNCTGARNPFVNSSNPVVLDDLIHSQLGVHNFTGGLATSSEGRLRMAGGGYSSTAYLATQASIGLSQPSASGRTTFIGSNRLTAVRVAQLAQRMANAVLVEHAPAIISEDGQQSPERQ